MKKLVLNLVKSTFVVALVLASSSIYAVGDVKIAPISGSKKARVYIAATQDANVCLTVLNQDGTEYLYSEKLDDLKDESAYNKVYDFDLLNEGEYKIVAESDFKIVEKDITVSNEGISVVGEKETFKPHFRIADDKLIVSYLNKEGKDVEVKFSDRIDEFFSDEKVSELNIMKAYSIEQLFPGEYAVSLIAGDNTYNYYFEVR
jgi:hypothetical protein